MRKRAALLALLALISSMPVALARGGRTTAADCAAGSDDPDCPDEPATTKKTGSSGDQSATPPKR